MQKFKTPLFIFIFYSAIACTSCSIGGQSKPSNFYMLEANVPSSVNSNLNDLSMGIGPIRIPGYIDRPQIVTKTSTAEIKLADFDRWAEPMGSMITRTIASNIITMTDSNNIHMHPWSPNASFDYQVAANIINFDNNESGDAILTVNWKLIDKKNESEAQSIHSQFHARADDTSYASRVAALNDVLAQFSQEIIKNL